MTNRLLKIAGGVIALVIVIYLLWYFSGILVYVLIAGVLSFIGHPLVRFFDGLRIGTLSVPHTISAVLSLIVLLLVFVSLFLVLVPIISRQATVISSIDFEYLGMQLEEPLQNMENKLIEYRILEENQSLEELVVEEIKSVLNMASASSLFQNLLGLAGSLFIGVFSVVFLTFFFLRDKQLFYNGIMLFVPTKYELQGSNILSDTRRLLSRYFVGLSVEVFSMVTLITIGLSIFKVENALLIGFLGGLMNIIPYLGPIIGASVGVLIAATSNVSMGYYEHIIPVSLQVIGTFAIANLIDNFILQPLIYSTSVKSHPIEIFLIILMAASIAGIPGMILAIPGYTVLRIVAKQFFKDYKVVRKLTENI